MRATLRGDCLLWTPVSTHTPNAKRRATHPTPPRRTSPQRWMAALSPAGSLAFLRRIRFRSISTFRTAASSAGTAAATPTRPGVMNPSLTMWHRCCVRLISCAKRLGGGVSSTYIGAAAPRIFLTRLSLSKSLNASAARSIHRHLPTKLRRSAHPPTDHIDQGWPRSCVKHIRQRTFDTLRRTDIVQRIAA